MKTAAAARQQQGRVLVVEDERDVADLIRYNLTKEGYDVVVAPTGSDALKQAREVHPDLVLLDIMVPQLNGIRAVARRGRPGDAETKPRVQIGELEIDRYRFEVRMKGRPVDLTPKEFDLLAILAG
ncbi:MAG: hypothetical protein DMF83_28495, partial [Acidobacteria bacterium]